jgi:transposase
MAYRALSDTEWEEIAWLLPEVERTGRHRSNEREVLNAILYVLCSGCHWDELPANFPPKSTVHRRLQELEKDGFFKRVFKYLRGRLPESTLFHLDTTLKPAKKGGKKRTRQMVQV